MGTQPFNIKDIFFKIFEFGSFLKKKRKTLGIFLLIFFCAGLVYDYIYYNTKEYKTEIKFILENEGGGGEPGGLAGLASTLGIANLGSSNQLFSGENFRELLKTEIVIRKALFTKVKWGNKEDILANLIFEKGHLEKASFFKGTPIEFTNFRFKTNHLDSLSESELYELYRLTNYMKTIGTVLNQNTKSSIQTLTVVSHSDTLSYLWAKQYLNSVSDYYIATKTKKTSEMVRLMEQRVDSLRNALYYTQGRLATFSDQNQQIIFQRARIIADRLQLNSAQLQQLYAEALRNYDNLKFSLLKETPLINIVSVSDFPSFAPPKTFGKITLLITVIGFFCALIFLFIQNVYQDFKRNKS